MKHRGAPTTWATSSSRGSSTDPRARHLVVISDAHLSQAHPADDRDPDWMRYRRREYHPDQDLAALLDLLLGRHPDAGAEEIELCFNGDVFDFDCPWVKDGESSFDEPPTDEAGCAAQAARIAADHPIWFAALARLLSAGHRLLFIAGNHDSEICFPAVRRTILAAIESHLTAPLDLVGRVRFRGWFHVTRDGVYLEHGSQYDRFNTLPHPMSPFTADRRIRPTVGKLVFKRIGSRLGYFNGFFEEIHYQGFPRLVAHIARRYLLGRRHFLRTWFFGATSTVRDVWRAGRADEDAEIAAGDAAARFETGASESAIRETRALFAVRADQLLHATLRELWLDRAAIAAALVAVTLAASTRGGAFALAAFTITSVLWTLYELLVPKPDIRSYDSPPSDIDRLFEVHGVRALCLGHTHRPSARWEGGRFRGNSGSWSPAYRDAACTVAVLDGRPLLVLTSADGALSGGLMWWRGGSLVPDSRGAFTRAEESAERSSARTER